MSAPQAPSELQPPIETHALETLANQQPVPEAAVSAPVDPVQRVSVSSAPPAAKKAAEAKPGPSVGVVAGVAVAALTLIGAGVGVALSRKKSQPSVKITASKAAAGTRTSARPTSSKTSGSRYDTYAPIVATSNKGVSGRVNVWQHFAQHAYSSHINCHLNCSALLGALNGMV